MRGLRLIMPACAIVGTLVVPISSGAQEATPEATPAARALIEPCTAEPRNLDALLALWFGPAGEPLATPAPAEPITDTATLPEGSRADEATIQAITETTQSWISCMEYSSQPVRGFSYMTDNFLAQFGPDLADPTQDSADEVRAALETQFVGTPVAPPSGQVISPLVGPRRARMLDDGRVGAIWSLGGNRFFFLYTQVDSRWLIDDAIDILETEGTPVAGTPTP